MRSYLYKRKRQIFQTYNLLRNKRRLKNPSLRQKYNKLPVWTAYLHNYRYRKLKLLIIYEIFSFVRVMFLLRKVNIINFYAWTEIPIQNIGTTKSKML